jgi:hypothetical protein
LTPKLCKKIPQFRHTPYILKFFKKNYTPYIKEWREYDSSSSFLYSNSLPYVYHYIYPIRACQYNNNPSIFLSSYTILTLPVLTRITRGNILERGILPKWCTTVLGRCTSSAGRFFFHIHRERTSKLQNMHTNGVFLKKNMHTNTKYKYTKH